MFMEENKRHYRALELDKILKMLAAETACDDAAALALQLIPSTSLPEVQRLLADTDEAHVLLARFGAPSFSGLKNVTNSLRRAEAGGTLNMAELLRIAGVLRNLRGIVEWRAKSAGVKSGLDWRFDALMPNKYLEDRIYNAILSEEEMADSASPQLASIRRKIHSASSRVREQLDKMIHSAVYQKYLQDPIVTLRGGRFVVPVKAECRGEIAGLVHDTSSSGATVFVEPMGVVEANNQVKVLQSQEQTEIERILAELSAETGNFSSGIIGGYQAAVELNLIFAKANLGYKMKASMPLINNKHRILLKKARHPLINPDQVVPTDIELGIRFDTLVITGPNTGGKTVALKTIGLLTLMAMCGLLLPVSENSEISIFNKVLADIGDEQSIEQSLSTFSAHMTNIIKIIENADETSLILLDELGAGTDPIEGAALAMAILEALRKKGAKISATTHYAELKVYALQTVGVENACCEFDVATLRPTYHLLIGVPGRSNAFAISHRLGLGSGIVDRAKELVSSENSRFEDVVQSLENSRQGLEAERTIAKQARVEAARAQQDAQAIRNSIQAEANKEIEKAHRQAAELVARTRGQIDAFLNEMDELKKQHNKTLSAEQKAKLKSGLRVLEETADPIHQKEEQGEYVLPRPLKVGDTVLLYDIDKQGTVLQLPEGNSQTVLVQAGIIQTRVPITDLRLVLEKPAKAPRRTVTRNVTARAPARVTNELDLRGQMADEAIMNVDRFIDSAVMSGLELLTIIHGKGTGALRTAVQQHLKHHPSVRTYRLGAYGEGEAGVTIVELK